ncbi:MAG TPA: MBL fold metallo-hydrolase [Chitinophagaceae bacterium]|nr:MBL fold metallo-hydrolase [Chitinophagaceae bacterium]MCC6635966.1 MBL fold metallo-hydrolase [Chitinophagaceae bacterium]HMZ45565.1 MBL fold metallo-hydrolase [Chitinophagaceae bacterium]HNE94227.1 MBL fold metallo-hydrolase [Chitinophagaceae bacterium]HNF29844.1 MBL fold metallo-hydrolase [Chitinophagaceae bacterium]
MITPLKITFLGTGTSSGVPMIGCNCMVCTSRNTKDKRLRSSILVQSATTTIVVDTTPDFRYQMLCTNTKHVDAILFTHPHKDHIAGLDDVRAFNFLTNQPMQLYANSLTAEALRRDFYYAFSDKKYPGVPNLNIHIIDTNSFFIGDIPIQPILVWHLNMPVFGYKFGNFTYITDANRIDEKEQKLISNSTILVLNALRKEKHISHFTLDEATQLAQVLQAQKTYFTHISHQLGLYNEINNSLPKNIELAYDGLVVEVS